MATELSKNIQLSQAHHVLCDRLSAIDNNEKIMKEVMIEQLGSTDCNGLLYMFVW